MKKFSLPRMRGDRPLWKGNSLRFLPFTPHARGSTEGEGGEEGEEEVYPACAGIDLVNIKL